MPSILTQPSPRVKPFLPRQLVHHSLLRRGQINVIPPRAFAVAFSPSRSTLQSRDGPPAPPVHAVRPRSTASQPPTRNPRHVAIIMDGNGRWARQRGSPASKATVRASKTSAASSKSPATSAPYLTLYAFSAENWRRPADEVGALMTLLEIFLENTPANSSKTRSASAPFGRPTCSPNAPAPASNAPSSAPPPSPNAPSSSPSITAPARKPSKPPRLHRSRPRRRAKDPDALDWPRFARLPLH